MKCISWEESCKNHVEHEALSKPQDEARCKLGDISLCRKGAASVVRMPLQSHRFGASSACARTGKLRCGCRASTAGARRSATQRAQAVQAAEQKKDLWIMYRLYTVNLLESRAQDLTEPTESPTEDRRCMTMTCRP